MPTKVLGYFDTTESAEDAEKSLMREGFMRDDIVIQSFRDKGEANTDHYVESLAHGQTLVVVTASGNVDEDRAIHILRECDAVKVNEIETRFRAGKLKKSVR